tara:strand:+ start:287 stop:811 length:525 start_codon:yes stop_codon:yes gene_type:complete
MADLTVTIKEDLTINNVNHGGQYDKIYTGIQNVFKSWGTIPLGTQVNLYTANATTWAGSSLETDGTKYVRITNSATGSSGVIMSQYTASNLGATSASISGTSIIRLRVSGSGGCSWHSLPPGDSFIITSHTGSHTTATCAYAAATFQDITSVDAAAQGAASSYNLFAAGITVTP